MWRNRLFVSSSIVSSMSPSAAAHDGSESAKASIGEPGLVGGLDPHPVDDPPHLRVELVGVDAAGRLRHVHHEVGVALELVVDPHHRDDEAQVDRDR